MNTYLGIQRALSQVESWIATLASAASIGIVILGGGPEDPISDGLAEGFGIFSMAASVASVVNGCIGYLLDATCRAQATLLPYGLVIGETLTPFAGGVFDILASGPWYFTSRPVPKT